MTTGQSPYTPHWIAKEIRILRNANGWSQVTLANMSEVAVTSASLANFETGKGHMQLRRIEGILRALGYEIDIHLIE
jgi:transcriptional regulator with XRE-family HTH domain